MSQARDYPELQKAAAKLGQFAELMEELRQLCGELELPDFYEELVAAHRLRRDAGGRRTRWRTAPGWRTSGSCCPPSHGYLENTTEEPSLAGFLDEIALYTDLDSHDPGEDCVVMMTMHSAKGLEFPVVFVVGVEEGIFPGIRAIGEPEEMEEERRLCYVAMTRAKEKLYMTCAAPADALRPHQLQPALPLCGGDPRRSMLEQSGRNYLDPGRDEEWDGFDQTRPQVSTCTADPYSRGGSVPSRRLWGPVRRRGRARALWTGCAGRAPPRSPAGHAQAA